MCLKKIYQKKAEENSCAPPLKYVIYTNNFPNIWRFFFFFITHTHICLKCFFFFSILCREYGCNFSRWDINQIAIRYYIPFSDLVATVVYVRNELQGVTVTLLILINIESIYLLFSSCACFGSLMFPRDMDISNYMIKKLA